LAKKPQKGGKTWLMQTKAWMLAGMARDQESRIAAAASVGLNAAKPLFQYQTSMLRLLADNFELIARNYEHGMEAFTNAVEQQQRETRQAAE
jgi:hypothetical protein